MRSVWIIILAYFLVTLSSCVLGICGEVLELAFSFVLAFFHKIIGWKKILIFLSASTFIVLSETFATFNMSLPFTDVLLRIPSTASMFLVLLIPSLTFAALYVYTLTLYCISLYLIRRWKIHARCGNTYYR